MSKPVKFNDDVVQAVSDLNTVFSFSIFAQTAVREKIDRCRRDAEQC